MREIRLRAKQRDLAHEQFPQVYAKREFGFSFGTGIYDDGVNMWLILENNEKKALSDLKAIIVDPETVGQFTELHDTSGKEIYEGDIVSFSIFDHNGSDKRYKGVVRWGRAMFEIWHDIESEYYGSDGGFVLAWAHFQDDEFEVIGNIHDNPELLQCES